MQSSCQWSGGTCIAEGEGEAYEGPVPARALGDAVPQQHEHHHLQQGGQLRQLCDNSTSLVTATDLTRLRAVTADSAARLGKA